MGKRSQPNQLLPGWISLTKKVKATGWDDQRKWHRIKVLGQRGKADGKPIWLTIKAVPVSVSSE